MASWPDITESSSARYVSRKCCTQLMLHNWSHNGYFICRTTIIFLWLFPLQDTSRTVQALTPIQQVVICRHVAPCIVWDAGTPDQYICVWGLFSLLSSLTGPHIYVLSNLLRIAYWIIWVFVEQGWTVRGSKHGGDDILHTRGAQPAYYTMSELEPSRCVLLNHSRWSSV
jgi:hypothetical protein